MSDNPFQSPPVTSSPFAQQPSDEGNPLLVPGIVLLVLASLTILLLIGSLPSQFARMAAIDTTKPGGQGELAGSIASLVAWTAFTVAIIFGSISMIRMRSYSACMTAAVLSVIPICSPCFVLGIPFGIWAIIVLRQPNVRVRFT